MQQEKLTLHQAHQRLLLSMLKELDAVCRRNGIPYLLFSGTALGGVRHQGFIPWDDDVDVLLLRRDYERLLDALERELDGSRYYVQREFGPHWPMQFSKLRRNGTACLEKYHPRDPQVHQGVYLDIFPCDALAESPLLRGLQFAASKVVIAKALYARGYETDSLLKKLFLQLCRPLPRAPLHRFCQRRWDTDSPMVHTFFACGTRYEKNIFPRSWITETQDLPFEDGCFPVSAHWDRLLTRLYGDYMTLPEPQQRLCKEHAAILDLERPYTDYLARQKSMTFDTYTRSIR